VTGEPCGVDVPDSCCPAGRDAPQDTSAVGDFRPLFDWIPFPQGVTGQHFTLRVISVYDVDYLVMREVEFVR
jgi:hypothetical protein